MTDKMLAAFAAAQRTGSFSTAAWELSMTQQAVSYSIKKLEEELGFPLFVRRASRVELTAEGGVFHDWYKALDSGAETLSARFPGSAPVGGVSDNQIRCFLTAARLGRLAQAAEALFYTPQNLLSILNGLEKALGLPLLTRETDRLSLTEAGAAWCNFFEEAAASLRSVRDYARSEHRARKSTALIGVSEWLDRAVLEEALADFDGDWELVSMTNVELLDSLERGEADAALWSDGHAPVNKGFETIPLARESMCLFVPAGARPCPLLICPGWPRSFLENRAISTLEMTFKDFSPTEVRLTNTLQELISLLGTGEYAAVGDARFGAFRGLPGLQAFPLGEDTRIVACRRANADDDCAARLLDHWKASFVGDTKD